MTRPVPDVPVGDATLEPREYSSPPASDTNGDEESSLVSRVRRYVTAFERVYRRNTFLERYGAAARTVALRRTDHRAAVIDSAVNARAVLVAMVYDVTTATRYSATDPHNEWDIRVVYYVDENVALRARYDGIVDTPAYEPDPHTSGTLVACFG